MQVSTGIFAFCRVLYRGMSLLPNHHTEERPWGSFELFTLNEASTVKVLHITPGKRFSLQTHAERSEYWKVLGGSGIAQIGSEVREVKMGDELELPVGTQHRLTGGDEGLTILEIALGTFEESDITRLEDDFGRS